MQNPTVLETEIKRLESCLSDIDPDSDEYDAVVNRIERLRKIVEGEKKRLHVSGDTIVSAGCSLLGILLILNHERLHAIPTKALGFVSKLRV